MFVPAVSNWCDFTCLRLFGGEKPDILEVRVFIFLDFRLASQVIPNFLYLRSSTLRARALPNPKLTDLHRKPSLSTYCRKVGQLKGNVAREWTRRPRGQIFVSRELECFKPFHILCTQVPLPRDAQRVSGTPGPHPDRDLQPQRHLPEHARGRAITADTPPVGPPDAGRVRPCILPPTPFFSTK